MTSEKEKAATKLVVELSDIEVCRIRACMFREAIEHKELSTHYKDQGYPGIAMMEAVEGFALMELREKFLLLNDRVAIEELKKKVKRNAK